MGGHNLGPGGHEFRPGVLAVQNKSGEGLNSGPYGMDGVELYKQGTIFVVERYHTRYGMVPVPGIRYIIIHHDCMYVYEYNL